MKKAIMNGFILMLVVAAFLPIGAVGEQKSDESYQGFTAKVSGDIYGQVKVIPDIDGDGKRDLIFGATDGMVHIWSAKGTEIFRPPNWPKKTGGPILSEVNVVDLDRDNTSEIIVGSLDGKVYCLNQTGVERWTVDTRGTIRMSPPEVSDVDGTGNFNIFVGSRSGYVSRIDAQGKVIWEAQMTTSVSGKVVAVDLDSDGKKEVIAKDDNGKVNVLKIEGNSYKGWPQSTVPNLTWPFDVGATDLNGDGLREVYTTTPDKKFIIWNTFGEKRNEFAISDGSHTAPRVADINGDGRDEFIIGQADGVVMVCDENGKALPGWPFTTKHSIYYSPQVIDIDGDGKMDIVYTAWNPEGVGKEAGYIMALSRDGQKLRGYPKFIGKSIAPLTFADLDGDGLLEMIAAGGINYTCEQLQVIPTKARIQIKIAVLGSEVDF